MKHEPLTNDKGELLEISVIDNLPETVKIVDTVYKIEYCDKPSDVDLYKRQSLWGQIDYWTRTIRIYKGNNYTELDVRQTLLHEILHGIVEKFKIDQIEKHADHEKIIDLLATGINVILSDNPQLFWDVKK